VLAEYEKMMFVMHNEMNRLILENKALSQQKSEKEEVFEAL
jgi:hypothetical protein